MTQNDKNTDRRVTRRRFCQLAGTSACAVTGVGAAALSLDYMNPRVLFEPPTKVTIGSPDRVSAGSVLEVEEHRLFVMHFDDGYRAISSICTHLGCVTRYNSLEKGIACPCHGSRFDLDGDVIEGPAPRALAWLEMDLSPEGEIVVDTAIQVRTGTVYKL